MGDGTETQVAGGRTALALEAYMAQVREAVGKALAALDRASAQVAEWAQNTGRPLDARSERPTGKGRRSR